ncbi:sodium-coupled neutral amino acid transporter 7-like isoform X2 [Halichondria panicea]|uniref:sodium-coupled neutral amino acid transporter 7-like isoform X2 n=1 Tax=Halichondria panicea TaxID=6063 RepID=UPI00312B6EF3
MMTETAHRNARIQGEDGSSGAVDMRAEEATFYYPWDVSKQSSSNGTAFGAVFIVVNAALGAGLLSLPLAFYQAGGVTQGIAIELVLLVFVISSVLVLAYGAELKHKTTYEDTVEAVCGPVVKLVAEICLLAFCFGSNITYLVIVGDQLEDMSSGIIQSLNLTANETNHIKSSFYVDRRFIIAIVACVFILPWLFFKKIGVLSYTSFLAVLCCFYIAAVVTTRHFIGTTDCEVSTTQVHCSRSWPDVVNAIPFICFGYQCHVSSIPIYVGLKKRTVKRFFFIIVFAVLICFVVYTLTGTFGYLTFVPGTCIQSDILRNYCNKDILVDVARGLLALVMVTSYPILTFCGRTPLDSILVKLFRVCRLSISHDKYKWARLRIESLIWFVITLALAILVEQISNVVSLTGGLAATFIFVFPGMMIIQFALSSKTHSHVKKTFFVAYGCFIIVIGSFIFGNSLVYTILLDSKLI